MKLDQLIEMHNIWLEAARRGDPELRVSTNDFGSLVRAVREAMSEKLERSNG